MAGFFSQNNTVNTYVQPENWRSDALYMYLKDSKKRLPEGVEVAARLVGKRVEVELSAEQLHAE